VEKLSKKELQEKYKNRIVIGGVFCIKCDGNDRKWYKSTKDMAGQINKFEFLISTNLCPEPGMSTEWNLYGAKSFSLEIIEEIKKGETQTDREFIEDIDLLFKMWSEKQQLEDLK